MAVAASSIHTISPPATRADIIEKLVKDGFVKREKKQMIPTEDGMKLITILPDVVKSPKLTADWENELTLVSKGEVAAEQFMSGIEAKVKILILILKNMRRVCVLFTIPSHV